MRRGSVRLAGRGFSPRQVCAAVATICLAACGSVEESNVRKDLEASHDSRISDLGSTSDSPANADGLSDENHKNDSRADVDANESTPGADSEEPSCGDGKCSTSKGEDCQTCPEDCGTCTLCGNTFCEPGQPKEDPESCPEDCGPCGDGVCKQTEAAGESYCAKDCGEACGDGVCNGVESAVEGQEGYCLLDCGLCFDGVCGFQDLYNPELEWCKWEDCADDCGDLICGQWEDATTCAPDCAICGDKICSSVGLDFVEDCPQDCVAPCGDGVCQSGEWPEECPVDCGACGDGVCGLWENALDCCPLDCPPECGNGDCDEEETETSCPIDCACLPDCNEEWECGEDDNGCGETCAACPEGTVCIEHACCVPDCAGKLCRDDGCGGSCGECPQPAWCEDGECVCVPDCAGKVCGDNGCFGLCGWCDDGIVCTDDSCVEGQCVFELQAEFCRIDEVCVPAGVTGLEEPCLVCDTNSPEEWTTLEDGLPCGFGPGTECMAGKCCNKEDNCAGAVCGPGACAGSCGDCLPDEVCESGACVLEGCVGDCAGKNCGDNGCGASCGTCQTSGAFCESAECIQGICQYSISPGHCFINGECVPDTAENPLNPCQRCFADMSQNQWTPTDAPDPNDMPNPIVKYPVVCPGGGLCAGGICCPYSEICSQAECGPGCGQLTCGECFLPEECIGGVCACLPDCQGKECGDDGCGGLCGYCSLGSDCDEATGLCQCVASCAGKECGSDGCGGSCGQCHGCGVVCISYECLNPDCFAKDCGDDGQGCICGVCPDTDYCGGDGLCHCDGDCAVKECGDDGCGGSCGTCPADQVCGGLGKCGTACDDGNQIEWDGCTFGIESELLVNDWIAGDQNSPAIATFADGHFVSTWQSLDQDGSGYGLYAQVFDAQGFLVSGEFQVNSTSAGHQMNPDLATLADGSLVVVWEGYAQDLGAGIIARQFGQNGQAMTQEYLISLPGFVSSGRPAIASLGSDVAIAWVEGDPMTESTEIYARVFTPGGSAVTDPVLLHGPESFVRDRPSVAALTDGGFVVVYHACPDFGGGNDPDGDGCGIFGRLVDADGSLPAGEFLVNSVTLKDQQNPSVGVRGENDLVVTWISHWGFADWDLQVRYLHVDGTPTSMEFLVWPKSVHYDAVARVSALLDGRFTVTWHVDQGQAKYEAAFLRFAQNGVPENQAPSPHSQCWGYQTEPDVALFPDGALVVVWTSEDPDMAENGQDGDGKGIFAMRYQADGSLCPFGSCSTEAP